MSERRRDGRSPLVRGRPLRRLAVNTDRRTHVHETLGPCWDWLGDAVKGGYGRVRTPDGQVLAHRWTYELVVGPIPQGMELDHLCRRPMCVNPSHLEPVTPDENMARVPAKAHCPLGHPYDETNTYRRPDGYRDCRECINRRSRERNARRRAGSR